MPASTPSRSRQICIAAPCIRKAIGIAKGFLRDPWPTWRYAAHGIALEREVFCPHGRDMVIIRWRLVDQGSFRHCPPSETHAFGPRLPWNPSREYYAP